MPFARALARVYMCVKWSNSSRARRARVCTCERGGSFSRVHPHVCADVFDASTPYTYGVATTSRLLKTIGLFCKRAL